MFIFTFFSHSSSSLAASTLLLGCSIEELRSSREGFYSSFEAVQSSLTNEAAEPREGFLRSSGCSGEYARSKVNGSSKFNGQFNVQCSKSPTISEVNIS